MKLGLITDIHEHVDHLRAALHCFAQGKVDQVVVIGDILRVGEQIDETCQLLSQVRAIGVWGNHDYGLCVDPPPRLRAKYSPAVLAYLSTLQPRLEIAGCYFTHVEPWLNPEEVTDLWYYEGPPENAGRLDRLFQATTHRIMFAGHYHQWLLATPAGIDPWKGESAVVLEPGRYFVVIGALCEGRFAIFDTITSELVPFNERRRAE